MYTRSELKPAIRCGKHRWPLLCQGGFRARGFSPARQRLQPALAFPAHMARFAVLCFSFPVPRMSFPVGYRAGNCRLTHCFKMVNPAQIRSNRGNSIQNRSSSLCIPCKTGKFRLRLVRSGLRPPPRTFLRRNTRGNTAPVWPRIRQAGFINSLNFELIAHRRETLGRFPQN